MVEQSSQTFGIGPFHEIVVTAVVPKKRRTGAKKPAPTAKRGQPKGTARGKHP